MSLKLKVLGLGLLALMAMSAFTVMNASAASGGHFTNDAVNQPAEILGTETTPPDETHVLHFLGKGQSADQRIGCHEESYTGTLGSTATSLKITPTWAKCTTTGDGTPVPIDVNGCFFEFTSGKTGQTHHTAHFSCPTKSLEITHPNCTITVPTQTTQGVTYDTITLNQKHAITLSVTVHNVKTQYHGGICIFLGTSQEASMTGSVTVEARDPITKAPVNLTSTTG